MDCTLVPRCSVYWVSRNSFFDPRVSQFSSWSGAGRHLLCFLQHRGSARLPAGITSPQPPSLEYLRSHDVGELPIPTGARQLSRVLQVSVRTRVKPQFPECLGP